MSTVLADTSAATSQHRLGTHQRNLPSEKLQQSSQPRPDNGVNTPLQYQWLVAWKLQYSKMTSRVYTAVYTGIEPQNLIWSKKNYSDHPASNQ